MTYRVVYRRDPEGWWVATVPRVRGCHTQGRTLNEARTRIREALTLFVEDADKAALKDDVRLPADLRGVLGRATRMRARADTLQAEASSALQHAAKALTTRLNLSVRDAAELLGLSHQRVHQLIHQI